LQHPAQFGQRHLATASRCVEPINAQPVWAARHFERFQASASRRSLVREADQAERRVRCRMAAAQADVIVPVRLLDLLIFTEASKDGVWIVPRR
jgi:hypothetical protein